jgi:hypothetical protein
MTLEIENKWTNKTDSCLLGWNAPRNSLTLVHPDGYGSKVSNEELNISFSPTPDYSGIAKSAAGGHAWAGVVRNSKDLTDMLPEAIKAVQSGISAILEVRLNGSWSEDEAKGVNGRN